MGHTRPIRAAADQAEHDPGARGAPPARARVSRRSVLAGAALGAVGGLVGTGFLVERDVLPGRVPPARALGQAPPPGAVPDAPPGAIVRGAYASPARRGIRTNWVIAYPPGTDPDQPRTAAGARLPVCVVLHGRSNDAEGMVRIGYPRFLAAAVEEGGAPFALAAIDGGDRYWHRRRDGEDPGAMILAEWLPRLARAGLAARPADRIAFLGWSMGAYGSLLLAARLGPARVAAVAAESPALWQRPGDSAPGAFDDREDFLANDVFTRSRIRVLERIPIRIDCGRADPFHTAATAFARRLRPAPVLDLGAGDHTGTYWRAKAAKTIDFIGKAFEQA